MRYRRSLVMVALLAVFALIGAACGEDEPTGEGTDETTEPTTEPTTGGETTEPTETTPAIPEFETLEEGVLKVGSCLDYPPFEYVEGDEEKGFDVEIAEEVAARLGLEVEWVVAPFDTIFVALNAGNFDMVAAATTITEDRDQQVDFSIPYFNTRQALIINTETSGDIASVDDLKEGDTVAVLRGSTSEAWAVENLEPKGIVLKAFRAVPPEFTDLEAGNVTAMINDESQSVVEVPKRENLEIVQYIDTQEVYGLVFAGEGGQPLAGLRDAVNVVLQQMIADGTYAEIFMKYFPDNEVPPEFQPES